MINFGLIEAVLHKRIRYCTTTYLKEHILRISAQSVRLRSSGNNKLKFNRCRELGVVREN